MIATKILNRIDVKINELKNDIQNLELETETSKYHKKIEEFILKYNQGILDKSLLDSFFNKVSYNKNIEITKTIETKLELEKLNNPLFEHQIITANKIIDDFINHLNVILSTIKNNSKTIYKIKEKKKLIQIFQNIKKFLNNNDKIIFNKETSEIFYELINELNVSEEEKLEYIKNFIQKQSVYLVDIIKEDIKEKENNLKEIELEKKRITKIEKIITETNIEENKSTKINLEEKISELLEKAKNIITNIEKPNETILLVLESLKNEESFENRKLLYMTISDIVGKKTLIQLDIKENIIPKLESNKNDSNLYEQLKNILEIYQTIENEYQNISNKPTLDKMYELKLDEEANICEEVNDTLIDIENILYGPYENRKNFKENEYNELFEKYTVLKNQIETVYDMVDIYYESIKQDNDLNEIKKELNILNQMNQELNILLTNLVNIEENIKDIEIENSEKFYGEQPENIFILLDNENEENKTYVESDIEEDNELLTYESFLKILKLQVNNTFNFKTKEANHKVKSDLQKESFLKKYRIKNIKSGKKRIGYSRFSTSIGEELEEYSNNPHIIFIYSFSNGAIDKDGKNQVNQTSIKRCVKNQEEIDYIINLFNTDWSKLDKESKEKIKNEIIRYIKFNNEKIDRIINKNLGKGVN